MLFSYGAFRLNHSIGIAVLVFGGFLLRYWAADLSPFLHLWDERYHALVAKNLAENWLEPTLMPNLSLNADTKSWTFGHIWLHKQPFFLWMMALSVKIFGATELAIRIPSVIFGSLSIVGVYRIGKNLVAPNVGFLAAFLMTTSNLMLQLTSGVETTDHNDAIFIALITCSFWFYSEYYVSKKIKWVFLIGLAVGCAILTKWLTGLIVFLPWGIVLLRNFKPRLLLDFILGIVIAVFVSLPWQMYAYVQFKEIYLHELAYSSLHFSQVIETHTGAWNYYFEALRNQYFKMSSFFAVLIILASFVAIWLKTKSFNRLLIIALPIFSVFTFFIIAQTKMPLFTFMISSLIYVSIATLLCFVGSIIGEKIKNESLKIGLILFVLFFLGFHNFKHIQFRNKHDISLQSEDSSIITAIQDKKGILAMEKYFLKSGEKYAIFNARPASHVLFTFYIGHPAFDFLPSIKEIQKTKQDGYIPVILKTNNLDSKIQKLEGVLFYDFPNWE